MKKFRQIACLTVFMLAAVICNAAMPGPPAKNIWANAKQLHPGIIHVRLTTDKPRLMCINLVRVDLNNQHLRFVATTRDADWGKPMPDCPPDANGKPRFFIRTKRISTGNFVTNCRKPIKEGGMGLNVIFAVNAALWSPWENPYNHKYADNMGLLVSGGQLVCPNNRNSSGLVVTKDRKLEFRDFQAGNVDISDIHVALCGFGMILRKNVIEPKDNVKDLHPRMVYGLSQDKRYLYLMSVDGRQPGYSMGASTYECAQLMQYAGAYDALNLDGGGSTTMVTYDFEQKKPVLLNSPTKGGTYQRPVGCSLGIFLR